MVDDPRLEPPEIVCLIGSTRFAEHFQREHHRLALERRIVLTLEIADPDDATSDPDELAILDELYRRKIDLSNRVHVINLGGYIGESTGSEIEYARSVGKSVTYMEQDGLPNASQSIPVDDWYPCLEERT